jgi:hypothetical protein
LAPRLELVVSSAATASTEPRPIRSVRKLFEGLRSPDFFERLAVLVAIQEAPAVALSFGIFEGQDVIDALIRESHRGAGTAEWIQWLGTLDRFEDARVRDFFFQLLCDSDEPIVLFAAARYLVRTSVTFLPERIYDLLLTNENPMRALAAALVLENSPPTNIKGRIRLALLSGGKVAAPELNPDTLPAWLEELKGAFQLEAMSALQAQEERAWIQLAMLWRELDVRLRIWLLQWGSREFQCMLSGLLAQAINSGEHTLTLEALRAMAETGEEIVPESVRGLATAFLSDPDPAVRQAAVGASPPGVNWWEFLAHETDNAVRSEAVMQLAKTECEQAIPYLIDSLRSGDWQVRAVAASCLITLGTASATAAKPLVRDGDQNIQTAAVRILLALHEDEWLKQELLI